MDAGWELELKYEPKAWLRWPVMGEGVVYVSAY